MASALLLQGDLWLLLFAATPLHSAPERTPVQLLAFATTFTATVVFATSLRNSHQAPHHADPAPLS